MLRLKTKQGFKKKIPLQPACQQKHEQVDDVKKQKQKYARSRNDGYKLKEKKDLNMTKCFKLSLKESCDIKCFNSKFD